MRNNVMIGSCSSAGRNLKTKRSSAAGKTLATTCKAKKSGSKTVTKPVSKAVVKKATPKPVVKKAVVSKPKTKKIKIDDVYLTEVSIGNRSVGLFRISESVLEKIKTYSPKIKTEKLQSLGAGTRGETFDEIVSRVDRYI